MKTIGIIGGISYHSTAEYYKLINVFTHQESSGKHYAKVILYSVNYTEFKTLQDQNNWSAIGDMLGNIAVKLEQAGAECLVLACNAAHLVADAIRSKIKLPFLHIAEVAAKEIKAQGISKIGILGTRFVMQNPIYTEEFKNHNLSVVVPKQTDINFIHNSILSELSKGKLSAASKNKWCEIIEALAQDGAEAVLFACTEIGMFISKNDTHLSVFDTTLMHTKAAVKYAFNE